MKGKDGMHTIIGEYYLFKSKTKNQQ